MTDRRREMNGCSQEALTINMAREHAATPRRNTGEKGKKGKKQHNTHGRNKRQAGKASPRASPWPANPHQPSHTHHRSAVSPRVRRFGPPHNNVHAASSHTQCTRRSDTPPPPPVQSHRQHTAYMEQVITQKDTRGSGSPSTHDAAPHSTRSHGAHRFLKRTYASPIPLRRFC
ncbi:hypothetical protein TCDM_10965 [Trypanosoma cruzi Dm28c]|uniref:Uncharacterized protein n=1 Tax=Trypanosoma cruzi Dm28c TaxID=1416333 RepID=V5B628_TRYCR|nr:hypothetical protein TCDM_10965 [Trypanosoma cruzi Dm28c]